MMPPAPSCDHRQHRAVLRPGSDPRLRSFGNASAWYVCCPDCGVAMCALLEMIDTRLNPQVHQMHAQRVWALRN